MSWVNEQAGDYTLQPQDNNKLIVFNSSTPVTLTLPDQSMVAWIGGTFVASVSNMGAGAVTVLPSSSTIDGQSSLTLSQRVGVNLHSDGSNYFTVRGVSSASTVSFGVGNPNTSGGADTPAFVQQANASGSTVTMSTNVVSGDVLVVAVGVSPDPGSGSVTLSDSLGTSFALITNQATGDNTSLYVFAGRATAGGANTIASSSGDTKAIIAAEFSGTIATVDVSGSSSPGDYADPTATSVTTTKNGDLIFSAILGAFGGGTVMPSTGFTALTTVDSAATLGAAYAVQPTAGAISNTYTSTPNYWAQALIALEANPNGPLPGSDKDIYFDTTSSTYAGFVFHAGTWNPF